MRRKNFNVSSFAAPFITKKSRSVGFAYTAEYTFSIESTNNMSIFAPSVYRDVFGMCGTNSCQSLYAAMSFWITGRSFRRGGG